jgi:beta-phosphoglucomutase
MKQAVLFDLDGVLIDSMPYHVRAWQEVFRDYGVEIQPEEIYAREGTRTADLARILIQKHGLSLSEEDIQQLIHRKSQVYNTISRAELMPGAVDLVEELRRRRLRLAIVTSTFRDNLMRILPPDFVRQFDAIVCGGDVTLGKPHPQPYLLAAEKVETEPQACVGVENAPVGIQAVKAAGMRCVALATTQQPEKLKEADFIFDNISHLLEHLNEVLA